MSKRTTSGASCELYTVAKLNVIAYSMMHWSVDVLLLKIENWGNGHMRVRQNWRVFRSVFMF